jgi:hypothetical protein
LHNHYFEKSAATRIGSGVLAGATLWWEFPERLAFLDAATLSWSVTCWILLIDGRICLALTPQWWD